MANYITEAFKKLDCLDEELFEVSKEGTEKLKSFMDDDLSGETVQVVDTDAEDGEDIEDSYVGKVILYCPACHTMHYEGKEKIEYNPDDDLVDIARECPYCHSVGGFEVVGEVAPYADIEVKVDDETVTDGGKEEEEEDVKVDESCKRSIKESDKPAASSIEDAQKWVDFDMKKYGHISEETNDLVRKAGFQIVKDDHGDYEVISGKYESIGKSIARDTLNKVARKKSVKEGYRGAENVELVSHGEWSDPDLIYDGYTFNYWDIEDALWNDFLDETGHKDSESNDPAVEKEFDEYVQDNVESYLEDVIAGGYFKKGSKSWHDRFNESCKNRKKVKEDKTYKIDRIDAKRDDRVERAKRAFRRALDDADAQRDDEKKEIKEGLSYGELSALADGWEKFKKKVGRSDADAAWEFIETECKDSYDDDEDKEDIFSFIGSIEEPLEEDIGSWIASQKLKRLEKNGKAGLSDEKKKEFDLKRTEYQARAQRGAQKADVITGKKANLTQRNLDKANELKKKGSAELGKETQKKNQIKRSRDELLKKFGLQSTDGLKKMLADAGLSLSEALRMEDDKLTEAFEKIELETETEKIKVESEPRDHKAEDETIVPLTDDTITEIEEKDTDDAESFDSIDEIDEEDIDELGEGYLKRVYENVNSFKTSNCRIEGGKLIVEGTIGFKSGKSKETSFIFESINKTKSGKVKILGENKGISKCKGAFTFTGKVDGNKFIAESLTYKYNVKMNENENAKRIYGRVLKK